LYLHEVLPVRAVPGIPLITHAVVRAAHPHITSCSTNGSPSFVALTGVNDYAGGQDATVTGGTTNEACDFASGVGSGEYNGIGDAGGAYASFIGGGSTNQITGATSVIGAGLANAIALGSSSFIGSGEDNSVSASGAFVGGGGTSQIGGTSGNAIGGAGTDAFIGTGDSNQTNAAESFVGSGYANDIEAAGTYAVLNGGARNVVAAAYGAVYSGYGNTASGTYAVILGGNGNTASGELSLADGYHADAAHNGSFVWSDYTSGSALVKDTATNQFVARASGGVYLYSNEAATSGVRLSPGSGTWSSLSDRDAKTDIESVNDRSILAKVSTLPVSASRYRSERGVRHVGPMAQDFYAAFGVGEDDRHITSIDEDGVALAAIKALHEENRHLAAELEDLKARNAALESRVFGKASMRR
jgi:hypothetical protein